MILTDTGMDPNLWQALQAATDELGAEPMVTIMNKRETHSTDPLHPLMAAALDTGTDCASISPAPRWPRQVQRRDEDSGKRIVLMEELTPGISDRAAPAPPIIAALQRLGNRSPTSSPRARRCA